jgi:SpoVK/Ycf46/Vps4 family AAA+-type ATPase
MRSLRAARATLRALTPQQLRALGSDAQLAQAAACSVAAASSRDDDAHCRARDATASLALWCALAGGAAAARCEGADATHEPKPAAAVGDDDTDAVARSLEEARRTLAPQLAALARARWPGAPPPAPPTLSLRDGGRTAVLRVALPRDADASSALLAAASALSALSAASSDGAPLQASAADTPAARQMALRAGATSLLLFAPRLDVGGAVLELELSKRGALTPADVAVLSRALAAAAAGGGERTDDAPVTPRKRLPPPRRAPDEATRDADAAALEKLEALGATVYPARPPGSASSPDDDAEDDAEVWGELAGYEAQKRAVEETLLLSLTRPEVYAAVAAATRGGSVGRVAPRGVLLAGPPGCGKTSCARALARAARVTLVYLPLEAIQSKFYGESERNLSAVFAACDALPRGCVLFLDELDALATRRGSGSEDMHEATRRSLSVLLRRLDGMESGRGNTVLIAATNRPQDLDPALTSRFDATIVFGLPDAATRAAIAKRYARQLSDADVAALADATAGFSGRDLRDVAESAERSVAAAIIRGTAPEGTLPRLDAYLKAAAARREALALGGADGEARE